MTEMKLKICLSIVACDELDESNQFRCDDNSCISKSLKCDGEVHCPNGEDERQHECGKCHFQYAIVFIFFFFFTISNSLYIKISK